MTAVLFHRLAGRELKSANAWYQVRNTGVGSRFLAAIESAVLRIERDPDSLTVERKYFRAIRVHRFPSRQIFERYGTDQVLIFAVAPTSRRPGYWSRRKS
jgi:hypothetical protein